MKSLRLKLAVWFGLSLLAVTGVFALVTYRQLEGELRHKTWQKDYPEHPDWILHGSFSEAEVRDILQELLSVSLLALIPLVVLVAAIGYWLARKSLEPISSVNRQLQTKTSKNLGVPIELPEADVEFRDLLRQLNDLLKRLDASFNEMNTYAAKVAHELRTPLAILRLKVEQAGDNIAPELAEELHSELHRLAFVVDQSLLIARAEQGRLFAQRAPCDLQLIVSDIVEDFQLLAREEDRNLTFTGPPTAIVTADERHLRQMIYNLLNNTLKHGQGDFCVRIKAFRDRHSLTIVNRVHWCPIYGEHTLGLGLRVVNVLLRLDPELHFQSRYGNNYYAVRLTLPATSSTADADYNKTVKVVPSRNRSEPVQVGDEDYFI